MASLRVCRNKGHGILDAIKLVNQVRKLIMWLQSFSIALMVAGLVMIAEAVVIYVKWPPVVMRAALGVALILLGILVGFSVAQSSSG